MARQYLITMMQMMIITNLLKHLKLSMMNVFRLRNVRLIRKKVPLSPWITKGLLKSINKKNKLYKVYLRSPTNGNLQKV